jgi:hypothetical protein
MKKVFLLVLLFSGVAIAGPKYSSNPGPINETSRHLHGTSFASIYNAMLNANAGNYEREENSLWSGRCYTYSNPNRPVAAALLFRGGRGYNTEMASLWSPRNYEDYYDYKSPWELPKADYVRPSYSGERNANYLFLYNGTRTAVRRDHNYIYEAILNARNDTEAVCQYHRKNY